MLVKLALAAAILVAATPLAHEPAWAQAAAPPSVTIPALTIIQARQAAYDLQGGIADAIKDGIAHDVSPKTFVNATKALAR